MNNRKEYTCTYLRPHQLRQRPNELRRRVDAEFERLFVDDFANGEPERGFEPLRDDQLGCAGWAGKGRGDRREG